VPNADRQLATLSLNLQTFRWNFCFIPNNDLVR
jgi:hypothetical protein